ncbi:hypothetical protein BTO30_16020 [Domibacillus antri]|uniref:DinB-like domain-containing protein n=1 Tax=Domibacillus antri TaxID=1714264 RepID=A0A1Q8Q1Q2_9BACI|nr:DinB family protein [Domibacillus antri]OLN21241.1 hypothetical protein BTO30_16020 [Domibacillus antri]
MVQERFAFHFSDQNKEMQLPEVFPELFAPGTKPAEWAVEPPSLDELKEMLKGQTDRIEFVLNGRLLEEAESYTTSSGLTMSTVGAFLTFTFYHEGMHLNTMKHILKAL